MLGQDFKPLEPLPTPPEDRERSCASDDSPLPKRGMPFGQSLDEGASEVPYDDVYERLNSELQVTWTTNLRPGNNKTAPYDKVAVLLISWRKEDDDLDTAPEVERLGHVFEDIFGFRVCSVLLTNGNQSTPLAQVQVLSYISDFVRREDGPHTLLIVYYAGHGTPGMSPGGLQVSGKRAPSKDVSDLVQWNTAEAPLQHTKADVFEILDCCYAGDLGKSGLSSMRCFEFLGATSSASTTRLPGPHSFTSALEWALKELVKERSKFTTSELARKIRENPDFPPLQVPVLNERNAASHRRIVLSPLPKCEGSESIEEEESDIASRRELLDLRFVLPKFPDPKEVETLAEAISALIKAQPLQIHDVLWGGIQPDIVQRVIKRWRAAARRKSLLLPPCPPSPSSPSFPQTSISAHGYLAFYHLRMVAFCAYHTIMGSGMVQYLVPVLVVGLIGFMLGFSR